MWELEKYLLFPKSRQMTLTWWACALAVYESMFYPSRLTFIQNKKEEDSKANIKRCVTVYEKLPLWQRQWQPMTPTELELEFPRSRSNIKGIPAGAHHIRSHTATWVISDESAFQDDLDEVLGAAKPALGKNGRFTAISSAQPSYYKQLVFDQI